MKIMVTGGAGYIGSHVAVLLLQAGYELIIYDNHCNSNPKVIKRIAQIVGKKVQHICGDIRNESLLSQTLREYSCEAVIHCAGLKAVGDSVAQPLVYYDNNVAGSLCLLRAMHVAGVKTLVFSSSATVYGIPQYLPITEAHPFGATNPYGRTKWFIELMLQDYFKVSGDFRLAILRYFNPVGAHESGIIGEDPQGIANNLLPAVAQVAVGRVASLTVWGADYATPDGTGVRDYLHVMDLARGHLLALQRLQDLSCFTVNLGTGIGYSVLDLINTFAATNNRSIPYQIGPRRPGDVAACYANADYALELLGWQALFGLEEMCSSAWHWQQKNPQGYQT